MTLDEHEGLAYELIKKLEWEDLTIPIRGVEKITPLIEQAAKRATDNERKRIIALLRDQKPHAVGYEWEEGAERWADFVEKNG